MFEKALAGYCSRMQIVFFTVAALFVSLSSTCADEAALRSTPGAVRVLVDSIHAHNALQTPTEAEEYSYHSVYGYRRAFDYLRHRGVQVDEIKTGRLDKKSLNGYNMVFFNLVSGDLPPFRVEEINALKEYVEAGGSLLIISDHSNCYYHAYKLMPLLEVLGIEVTLETACERAPHTLGTGNGWLAITRFTPHPVTQDLRSIAIQTGGTVDERFAIARTSEQSWGDLWQVQPYGEGNAPGFYGNWKQDAGERKGPLGVVLAREVGKGRVVIAADQNIFGDPFINYADNYRLWLNSVAWLTGDAQLAAPQPYQQWRGPRVLAYEKPGETPFGDTGSTGFYNLFVALGRHLWLFASEDTSFAADALLFADNNGLASERELAGVLAHLKRGGNIVVFGTAQKNSNGPTLITQIEGKLGKPEIEEEATAALYSWPEAGHAVVLPNNQGLQNNAIPAPEKRPDDTQQLFIDTIVQVLKKSAAENRQD